MADPKPTYEPTPEPTPVIPEIDTPEPTYPLGSAYVLKGSSIDVSDNIMENNYGPHSDVGAVDDTLQQSAEDFGASMLAGEGAYASGKLGARVLGPFITRPVGAFIGAATGGAATRVGEELLRGKGLEEYDNWKQAAVTPILDFADWATGAYVARKAVGEFSDELMEGLGLAKRKGLITEEAYDQAVKDKVITGNTKKALESVMERVNIPTERGRQAVVRGEMGIKSKDTLRTSAVKRSFQRDQAMIESLPEWKDSKNILEMAERNDAAIEKIHENLPRVTSRLDSYIETHILEKHPELRDRTQHMGTGSYEIPQDMPATITRKDMEKQLAPLRKREETLRASKQPEMVDQADEIKMRLDTFYERFESNDGLMLPSETFEANKMYNELRRNKEHEFSLATQGKLAQGDRGVISETARTASEIQSGIKRAWALKTKETKNIKGKFPTTVSKPDVDELTDGLNEVSARYTLATTLEKFVDDFELGVSTRPMSAVSQTAGQNAKSSMFTDAASNRMGLVDRGFDALKTDRAVDNTLRNQAEFNRATRAITDPVDNIRAMEKLRGLPVPSDIRLGRRALAEGAGLAAAGAAEAVPETFGPEDVFADFKKNELGMEVQDALQHKAALDAMSNSPVPPVNPMPTGVDQIFGPDAFVGTPEPQPPPVPDFDLPRNSDEFFSLVTPEMLQVYAPNKLEEYMQLLTNNPSDGEKQTFISGFAMEQPELFEHSPVPGYKSIVDNKVTDPAEQELYREEVINKIEKSGERILAKSQFNKDFSIASKRARPRSFRRKKLEPVGTGKSTDTAEERKEAAEKRVEGYQY